MHRLDAPHDAASVGCSTCHWPPLAPGGRTGTARATQPRAVPCKLAPERSCLHPKPRSKPCQIPSRTGSVLCCLSPSSPSYLPSQTLSASLPAWLCHSCPPSPTPAFLPGPAHPCRPSPALLPPAPPTSRPLMVSGPYDRANTSAAHSECNTPVSHEYRDKIENRAPHLCCTAEARFPLTTHL